MQGLKRTAFNGWAKTKTEGSEGRESMARLGLAGNTGFEILKRSTIRWVKDSAPHHSTTTWLSPTDFLPRQKLGSLSNTVDRQRLNSTVFLPAEPLTPMLPIMVLSCRTSYSMPCKPDAAFKLHAEPQARPALSKSRGAYPQRRAQSSRNGLT